MSVKSTYDSPVHVICKILLFDDLSSLHVRVYFGVVENLLVTLLVRTLFINIFSRGAFGMERFIIPCTVCPIRNYLRVHDIIGPPGYITDNSYTESNANDQLDKKARKPLFWVAKCLLNLLNREGPLPVTTSSAAPMYMALHPN